MKKISYLVLLVALLVGFASCTKTEDRNAEITALQNKIRDIEKENEKLKNLNGETGIVSPPPVSPYSDAFLQSFCLLLTAKNPAELLKGKVENEQYIPYYLRILENLKTEVSSCEYQKAMLYDHPFDLAEFKTEKGYLYVEVNYAPDFKMRRFTPMVFEQQLEMSLHKVATRDGTELTTWKIMRKGGSAKKGAIFLRTPYMVYGGYASYAYLATYFDKMLILQANRGSHNSTGDFKWLDPMNIEDSRDSLDWIVQQPRSNGRVMAYGVSYDGYDALATAATNHPALKSVIACSAPANAATDSFTSSQFVENGIFGYVTTDRRNETVSDMQDYFEFIKTDVSKEGRSRMDDILLGLDSAEWNLTSEAIDDRNHAYWKDRQLLDALTKANMPIAHVAGMVQDQDGRDTLLAFNHIDQYSQYRNQNYLILHKDGHGCGDFLPALPLSLKLVALTDDDATFDPLSEPRFSRYMKKDDKYLMADRLEDLPLGNRTIEFAEGFTLEDYALQEWKDPNLYSKTVAFEFEEDFIINGAPTMKLVMKGNVPEVPVHLHFYFVSPMGTAIEGTYGWRTAAITDRKDQVETAELTFPLINAKVPKGSSLVIEFSTHNVRVFLRSPDSRNTFTTIPSNGQAPGVEIIVEGDMKTSLDIPIEREEEAEPVEVESPI